MGEEFNAVSEDSGEATPLERRGHPRYPFTATVEVIEPSSKTCIQGRTTDLSSGGCYVDTINSLLADTIVEMRLTKENRSFKAQAKVAYTLDGMGMGMNFIQAAPEQMQTLENWIGQLSGKLPPEPVELQYLPGRQNDELYYVLNELIIELLRQGILSEIKYEALLQQLHRNQPSAPNTSTRRSR